MILILKALLMLLCYMFSYYTVGILCNRIMRSVEASFTITMLRGMFLYSIGFMLYAMPMKYRKTPLHLTALVWEILWGISMLLIVVLLRRDYLKPLYKLRISWQSNPLGNGLVLGFSLLQITFVELFGRWNGSYNPAYYMGYVSTGIFNDQLGTYSEITGLPLSNMDGKFFTQTTLDHSAVMSLIFHAHQMIEIRDVLPALYLIMANLIIWLTAKTIYENVTKKQVLFYFAYQFVIAITATSYLLGGYYYYFRNYEGKAVSFMIVALLFFWISLKLYQNPNDKETVVLGVLCNAASFHFTGTGLFLIPATLLYFVPLLFNKKARKQTIRNGFCFLFPWLLYLIYYICWIKGWIPQIG